MDFSQQDSLKTLIIHRQEPAVKHQEKVQTFCEVTLHYFGSKLRLDSFGYNGSDEIMVEQQHCGGNTLPIFRRMVKPNSSFSFSSRRHYGFPFSLSIYVNGVCDSRLSTCCEYKHRKGFRLGGKTGHFSIVSVNGSSPCTRCCIDADVKGKMKKNTYKRKRTRTNKQKGFEHTKELDVAVDDDNNEVEISEHKSVNIIKVSVDDSSDSDHDGDTEIYDSYVEFEGEPVLATAQHDNNYVIDEAHHNDTSRSETVHHSSRSVSRQHTASERSTSRHSERSTSRHSERSTSRHSEKSTSHHSEKVIKEPAASAVASENYEEDYESVDSDNDNGSTY